VISTKEHAAICRDSEHVVYMRMRMVGLAYPRIALIYDKVVEDLIGKT